jgi:hypothetical protein
MGLVAMVTHDFGGSAGDYSPVTVKYGTVTSTTSEGYPNRISGQSSSFRRSPGSKIWLFRLLDSSTPFTPDLTPWLGEASKFLTRVEY